MKLGLPSLLTAALFLAAPAPALAQSLDWECGRADRSLSPLQVFDLRIAALARGDMQTVACTYQEDAVVVFPGQVITGRDAIMQAFMGFGGMFGGAMPDVRSKTVADDVLLVTYTLQGGGYSIPDGADTFVLRKGRIAFQTVHATVVPQGSP